MDCLPSPLPHHLQELAGVCSCMASGDLLKSFLLHFLQTSLAVGDVLEVRRKAELRKLELQVSIV